MPKKPQSSKANQTGSKKSPSNPRYFTEKGEARPKAARKLTEHVIFYEWKLIVFSFISGIFVMVLLAIAVDTLKLLDELEMKQQERVVYQEEIQKWNDIVKNYPDYRDGYFNLALLYFHVGNMQKSGEYVEKSLSIDPQFSEAKLLQEKLVR